MGCYAAFDALRVADGFCHARPYPHEAPLAADRLAAGVYFVRLIIDGMAFAHPFVVVH